jgi:hypothetical protein
VQATKWAADSADRPLSSWIRLAVEHELLPRPGPLGRSFPFLTKDPLVNKR